MQFFLFSSEVGVMLPRWRRIHASCALELAFCYTEGVKHIHKSSRYHFIPATLNKIQRRFKENVTEFACHWTIPQSSRFLLSILSLKIIARWEVDSIATLNRLHRHRDFIYELWFLPQIRLNVSLTQDAHMLECNLLLYFHDSKKNGIFQQTTVRRQYKPENNTKHNDDDGKIHRRMIH